MNPDPSLVEHYGAALKSYLENLNEEDLHKAYQLGRDALAHGRGLLEMTIVHHEALAVCLMNFPASANRIRVIRASGRFFLEYLTPFEMSLRGFRESNAALKMSEERYRALVENASDIVFSTDMKKNFILINKAAELLTGYSAEELLKMNLTEIVAPEHRQMVRDMLKRKLEGVETTTYQLEIIHKQGFRVPMEVSTRLLVRGAETVGVHGIARDIREHKRTQAALIQLNEALEEQAKRIAHELHDESGQLLASVHIALEGVARNLASREKKALENIKNLLDQIESQLRRLSHELRPTILDDLGLPSAIEFLAQGVSQRSHLPITVESDIEGRLPAQVEVALYRVVQEALNNAAKHSGAKGVNISISRDAKTIHCSVSDDGVGFESKAGAGRNGRPGLGLVAMRERLAAVGGTIAIRTGPGEGTKILASVPTES
ncbi:MAG TPA: PAS domain S-box protein [Terriglobia bacterium]|nr:PAS domain S-box protein [Terriglobia bacterium]